MTVCEPKPCFSYSRIAVGLAAKAVTTAYGALMVLDEVVTFGQHPQAVEPGLALADERRQLGVGAHEAAGEPAIDLGEEADPVGVVEQRLEPGATVLGGPVGVHDLRVVGAGVLLPQPGRDGQVGVDVAGSGPTDLHRRVSHGGESRHGRS